MTSSQQDELPDSPCHSRWVKKSICIFVGLLLAVAGCALMITLTPARPNVSMTFLEYKHWPHGAMLRLTNGTKATIRFRAEQGVSAPVLLVKTVSGVVSRFDGVFTMRSLGPGKSLDFFVLLEQGAAPEQAGTICYLPHPPQSRLSSRLQPWLFRVKRWWGIKVAQPGQTVVWCPVQLSIASSQQSVTGK
jgi:hypothetical protein